MKASMKKLDEKGLEKAAVIFTEESVAKSFYIKVQRRSQQIWTTGHKMGCKTAVLGPKILPWAMTLKKTYTRYSPAGQIQFILFVKDRIWHSTSEAL